jgi:hypothetical protein
VRRNGVLLSHENAVHRARVLAEIGRGLREGHDEQPLPDRLADLVRKIEQSSGEGQAERLTIA